MLIGVIGDSHNKLKDIDRCIKKLNKVNIIIHTGDMVSDAQYILDKYNIPIIGVSGNCDPYDPTKEELTYMANNNKIFICHGHTYGVKNSLISLFNKGKELNANVVVFGHTHIPFKEKIEGIYFLNPGSISFPRGMSNKSIALMEINETISIKHIEV